MKSFNQVTFVGHVGQEPQERTINKDNEEVKVCDFSLAVDEGRDKDPLWLSIVTWQKLAEQVKTFVHKGDLVLVSGKLHTRTYTDKTNVERTAVEVTADLISCLGPKEGTKDVAPVEDGASAEPAVATAS